MKVDGKVAIVTGSSSGIGKTTAILLAKHGAIVVLVSHSQEKNERIVKTLPNALAIAADMTKPKEIKSMITKVVKTYGKIDILVNNAGQGYDAPVEKIHLDTFRHIFALDLLGPLIAMQQVIPLMRNHGGDAIINISSGTSTYGLSAYGSILIGKTSACWTFINCSVRTKK